MDETSHSSQYLQSDNRESDVIQTIKKIDVKIQRQKDGLNLFKNSRIMGRKEQSYEPMQVLKASYVPFSDDLMVPRALQGIILVDVNKDALALFGVN